MNVLKTAFLLTLLTLILVLAGRLLGGTTGMVLAFGLALAMNGAAYWFSDKVALAQSGAHEVGAQEAPELHQMVDRLAAQYQVPKPRVYVSPDPTPNAFATGRNPQHAAVCVNEGLLRILDREEVYGVLAHEFAHVRNRDILISSIVAVLAGAITLLAQLFQFSLFFGGGDDEEGSNPLGLVGALLMAFLAPLAAMLIQLAISRTREYAADGTAGVVTGRPLALASALSKLHTSHDAMAQSGMAPQAQPAFAHLYIVNPLSGGFLAGLFSTHPPVAERIRRLQALAAR